MEYGVHDSHTEKNFGGAQGHTNDLQLRTGGTKKKTPENIYKELGCPERIKNRYTSFFIATAGSTLRQLLVFISETKEEPDTFAQALEIPSFANLFTKRLLNQCGYLQIPYLPEVLVPTIFFRRNNKQH
mgnify:CR=1 FL=1